jgi:hypothetical protein
MTTFADRTVRLTGRATLAVVLAVAAALAVYRAWGGLDRPGLYHDEKAYVLQSRIYTDLRWAEPSPPVPALWEQVHVFTEPHYASRYPPGFPAVLAMGTGIGLPGIVPVLCAAATAALLFLFGAELTGKWTAFLATSLWVAAPGNTVWRAAYFSESLTGLLWVSWCWCAWRYRRDGRRGDLIATSLLVAFAGITRPMTAIALAFPLIVILWPRLRAAVGRRHALAAAAAGLGICAVVPVWSHGVLDSWTTLPYAEYSARTYPFDMPTWKTNWAPPPRELPPDMQELGDVQRIPYEHRSLDSLPGTFVSRGNQLGVAALPKRLSVLRFLAPIGLLAAGGAGLVALASALLLLIAHLTMPHPPEWTIYYLDVFPVIAFGVVIALRRGGEFVAKRVAGAAALTDHAPRAALVAGLALIGAGVTVWAPPSIDGNGWMRRETYFRSGACALPAGQKIVFISPRPKSSPHHILVDNDPRWERSDLWVVRAWDQARNRALMDAAPARAAYYYDEQAGWFARMNRDGTPTHEGVVNVLKVDQRTGRGIACK